MRKRFISVERLEEIARHAILGGYGTLHPYEQYDRWGQVEILHRRLVTLNLAMGCSQPYEFELHARYSAEHGKEVKPMTIRGASRCRKCEPCQKSRARFWTGRAMSEYGLWPTSLMGTFTLSPDEHYLLDARIMAGTKDEKTGRWLRHPKNLATLSPEEIFQARATEFGVELTKWLKRIRKGDQDHPTPQVRYLLVAEAHDSVQTSPEIRGRPHFHILLHEQRAGSLVLPDEWERRRYRSRGRWKDGLFVKDDGFLRKNWEFGFTKFQLAESSGSASYLCKYLTKTLLVRVRASQGYGTGGAKSSITK